MKVGTKSVLFGAHCWFIHPWFVALAWWKLYGFPWDPRLWVAFFVHDLGYLGKPNMDGGEGEAHVFLGAMIMGNLFGSGKFGHENPLDSWWARLVGGWLDRTLGGPEKYGEVSWYGFSFYHSRFMAKRYGEKPSRLCMADKLSVALEPWWLYLPRVYLSGELWEYMAMAGGKNNSKYKGEPNNKYVKEQLGNGTIRGWFNAMTSYCRDWAYEHADGREDTWTPSVKANKKD